MRSIQISDDVLFRYVSGKATIEEIASITAAMKKDKELHELVSLLENSYQDGLLTDTVFPMESLAAVAEGNLCDVLCEQFILKDYLGDEMPENISEEARENRWLKESGTPLHNMGRLLEKYGMSVVRRYDCTTEEIIDFLQKGIKIIAVVDHGRLTKNESDGFLHAIVCLEISEGMMWAYDPASDGCHSYSLDYFKRAWKYSNYYLVYASAEHLEYLPHPIDVSEIELDEQLLELTEAIAENAHEVWSLRRKSEGYVFGPQNNSDPAKGPLTNKDLRPYMELPESEKDYDRDMAMTTIKLVKKLGFNITRKYTLYCPKCGEFVSDSMKYCPNCGERISVSN